MTYAASWTNGNAAGRVGAGSHWIKLTDMQEPASAINRRRRLTYQSDENFTIGDDVSTSPTSNFRTEIIGLLSAPTGGLGGTPATPGTMEWLWPVTGGDENKKIVSGSAGANQVNLFAKLNATNNWTNPSLAAGDNVRAVHCNELRQAIEWLRRGRWELPIYFSAGIFSMLPDTPWLGEHVANNGSDELRALGFAILRSGISPTLGLTNVTVRVSSELELTADTDCQVQAYHCLRNVDFISDTPTWNEYDPSGSGAWATAGGLGSGDATSIGSLTLTADTAGTLSNAALRSALQNMIDGSEQNLLIRRSDTGNETINITGKFRVEFDLDSPPN